MAIYSCNISNVSRAKGSSSCATFSYISGEKVRDERLGKTFRYGREERVILTETLLPEGAPVEFQNPVVLFNAIEKYENTDNARTAKKIMVALPKEFDLTMQKKVVDEFIEKQITSRGYACSYAIHHDKENMNPHAHILIANRQIDKKTGEWTAKRKMEYALDEQGARIPIIDPSTGKQKVDKRNRKQWKRINAEQNVLDKKAVGIYSGGVNYFPFYPVNKDVASIDMLLQSFGDDLYTVSLKLIKKVMEQLDSETADDWNAKAFIGFVNTLLATDPTAQGKLIVRRNRDIGKGTGTLLSPTDRNLGDTYPDDLVLTMYKITGNKAKGWDGTQLWIPNIKLPGDCAYYTGETI
mgnify:CR=1 FL=1